MRTISQQELNWRRDKVRDLTIKGWTQRQIAEELQIDCAMINRDLKFMRQQSAKNIQHYIDEHLPTEYENAINTMNLIVKEMWELSPTDNRELIQSRQLIKECTLHKVELIASGTVVDRAIKFVERHRGLILQKTELMIDDTAEPIQNLR